MTQVGPSTEFLNSRAGAKNQCRPFQKYDRERRQDGGESLGLTFSHKNTKIITNCLTTISKYYWNLLKNIFYMQR